MEANKTLLHNTKFGLVLLSVFISISACVFIFNGCKPETYEDSKNYVISLTEHISKVTREINAFTNTLENPDPNTVSEFSKTKQSLENTIKTIDKLNVPRKFTDEHEKIKDNLHKIINNIDTVIATAEEVKKGTISIDQFKQVANQTKNDFEACIKNINNKITQISEAIESSRSQ